MTPADSGRPCRPLAWAIVGSTATIALVLAGCTSDDGDSSTSSTSSSTLPTPDVTTIGSGDVVELATAFADTLDDDQKEALYQDYTFANASDWSNLPNSFLGGSGGGGGTVGGDASTGTTSTTSSRVGLQTDSLSDEQWQALYALLAAATGSGDGEGFDEIYQHLLADDYLDENGGGDSYGHGNFFIAFLGEPSDSGTWELQFGGHHLAVSNTYTDGALAGATPSFRGIEPFTTTEVDGVELQAEQQEQAAFAALLQSFDEDQLSEAKLDETFGDVLLGPGSDWAFPDSYEGIKGSELSDDQQALLLAAINTYVDDVDDADAATILAEYESELDDTYVAYTGSTEVSSTDDYVRIDGPSVWIEFSEQDGVVLSGTHPHAVWRDKQSDYGGSTS
ncbi:MAG: DUF3500 domain-containing protein [Microbacteriaceae bacterium]